ncbi:hypothetical protein [Mycoplasmopsis columboralis]|uniref:Lipoprotein n=1 Tax=Mycoplasmopsis columboralis TaxID=171282 RepID=A0A449B771_9BACT|nr:hypothetical protein [Mycoplasmopsis columboralis]VEU76432.1 Uncharacterised protein [Mycoplasmopsis columboralis]
MNKYKKILLSISFGSILSTVLVSAACSKTSPEKQLENPIENTNKPNEEKQPENPTETISENKDKENESTKDTNNDNNTKVNNSENSTSNNEKSNTVTPENKATLLSDRKQFYDLYLHYRKEVQANAFFDQEWWNSFATQKYPLDLIKDQSKKMLAIKSFILDYPNINITNDKEYENSAMFTFETLYINSTEAVLELLKYRSYYYLEMDKMLKNSSISLDEFKKEIFQYLPSTPSTAKIALEKFKTFEGEKKQKLIGYFNMFKINLDLVTKMLKNHVLEVSKLDPRVRRAIGFGTESDLTAYKLLFKAYFEALKHYSELIKSLN